ncbi:MAG: hypothetical protein JST38_05465 [Bacteroidetes bacterium]|nr:hypothetical protein [Bacteroidota bacterium]
MSFRGPSIIKINGGLGQQAPSDRNVAGLLLRKAYFVPSKFETGKVYELHSLDDATALGLSPASDANNTTGASATTAMAWYHISEFFRLNPDGTLFVKPVPEVPAAFATHLGDIMAASGNRVRYIGVVYGFDPATLPTVTGGFGGTVAADIATAQQWVEAQAAANVYVDCVVLGGIVAAAPVDLKALNAPQVHVTVACDSGYFAALGYPANFASTAAVGTVLGSIGCRMLSESIGSVMLERYPGTKRGSANYTLTDTRQNRWVRFGTSSGNAFEAIPQNQRDDLTAKGYGYAGYYEGYLGVYLNGDATCTLVTDDFNTIHTNRIWNEAARMVRRALIPRMNSRVRVDPSSGKVDPATIADWDAAAKRQLDGLLAEGEIADFAFRLDPDQDVIATGKVVTKLSITPQGIAKAIEAEIGFTNPAQA